MMISAPNFCSISIAFSIVIQSYLSANVCSFVGSSVVGSSSVGSLDVVSSSVTLSSVVGSKGFSYLTVS